MKNCRVNEANDYINYGYYFQGYEKTSSQKEGEKENCKISKIDGGLKRMIIFSLLSAGIIFLKMLIF